MASELTPEIIRELYHMVPLDREGGVFCQTYISDEILPEAVIPGRRGDHTICSAILFLLSGDCFSRMHRLPTEEIFHFYMGDPVEMLQLYPDGTGEIHRMGQDILHGEELQLTVRRGTWQGTRLVPGGKWALLGTSMAPGMERWDYEDGNKEDLQRQYPQFRELLEHLAGEAIYG
ncbi:MAG: cupin domain-containing protein [Oscillospiraceae bacterium]|nr:cupin domain-containing protein [Oscillospiraceae bacterium]